MEAQFNNKNKKKKTKWHQLQIIEALQKCKFVDPVPVQEAAIPLMLKNYDLAVEAQTGSGKTLAFVIPLLERYLAMTLPLPKTVVKFLVLSPTRQLCQQTYSVTKKLLENLPDKTRTLQYLSHIKCITGGNDLKFDIEQTSKALVLIGTVGRVKEVASHYDSTWLKKVQYLYIDEADRVLKEKGIIELLRLVQKVRRTAMFSATLQGLQQRHYEIYGMRNLAKISLKSIQPATKNELKQEPESSKDKKPKSKSKNKSQPSQQCPQQTPKPQQIKAAYTIPGSLSNCYLIMQNRMEKINFLFFFLQAHLYKSKIIVFVNTCASVEFYTKLLNQYFVKSDPEAKGLIFGIHGKLKNQKRARIIQKFTQNKNGCLISTDVTSRGIDFDRIHYIVQIDPPEDPDNYIHRIGRTARINRPGVAILMVEPHEEAFINYLHNKSVGVKLIESPSNFVDDYERKLEENLETVMGTVKELMLSDRDFIQKAKKAFVSYIRSYKEHELKYIFEFKNLSIGYTAQSFFLLRIPRIKQILGKKVTNFTQSPIDPQSIPWGDKNQQAIYQKKRQRLLQERQARDRQQAILQAKVDIKNKKSMRKKTKEKRMKRQEKSLGREYNELKREKKKGGRMEEGDDEWEGESQAFEDEDTEEIEARLGVNKN